MRSALRVSLIGILVIGLFDLPSMAAGEKPLGMVVMSENAHLGDANAAMGADLYSGDSLETDPNGTLRLKVSSSQIYLASSSAATLAQQDQQLRIKLTRGTVGFSSGAGDRLEIETPVGIVRAANGQRAFGEVTLTSPQKILVAAYHGDLVVEGNGGERTVKEGEAYNVTFVPDAASASPESVPASPTPALGPGPGGHLLFDAVVLAGAGGFGYLMWHVFTESDDHVHP
ncbi:MAG: hypothetical protein ACRD4C_05445 [Candidatus Acidiferrales bacterium]